MIAVPVKPVVLAANEPYQEPAPEPAVATPGLPVGLPARLSWHTIMAFAKLAPEWRILYTHQDKPVLIERQFGKGTIVLATDSYFVTNEAMLKERHTTLLTWLTGGAHSVIFDERHLGVGEQPGLASLLRRYRLQGLFAGLLLVAALYVWRQCLAPFPPPPEEDADLRFPQAAAGRGTASALVNLLRRSVAVADLPATCFAEWRSSRKAKHKRSQNKELEMKAVLADYAAAPPRQRDAVATYRRLSEIAKRKEVTGE
jgi:hypothetical protein